MASKYNYTRIRKKTHLNFDECKTPEDLRTRIQFGVLKVGNRYNLIKEFLSPERTSEEQIECVVSYTHNGLHHITRFV